jgi:DNA topoisomerase-2
VLFPTILKRKEPFLISLKTPIVRVFQKPKDLLFYDERKFKEFAETKGKKFEKKYYKGLGTTKPEDVPDTFGTKIVEYITDEETDKHMNKVFHKKFADDRKKWLEEHNPSEYISLDDGDSNMTMTISDFINGEMIKFSIDDCARSIPCMIDGLKNSQRKCLYAVKKKKLQFHSKSLKVAQLGGYVAEQTNYHHGEQNLYETIVKMANEYVGSNNIPLFYRDGMFSTRLNFKDAASARYIYTKMDMLTEFIFRSEDDVLLRHNIDDGDIVEPVFYVPIIPMVLINGVTAAIGSGYSSNIPNYNPLDIIQSIKIWLLNDGKIFTSTSSPEENETISVLPEFKPWYRNFKGEIVKVDSNKFMTKGNITKIKSGTYEITELPIGLSTDKFKEMLEDLIEAKQIKTLQNHSTPKKVNFIITSVNEDINIEDEIKLYTYLQNAFIQLFTHTAN